FGTLKGKAAIKDVGRVLDFTFAETDRIAKLYPEPKQGKDFPLEQALEMEPRLRELRDSGERERRLFDLALRLEGLLRHASKHAAGIVISNRALVDDVPLWVDKDGAVVTQYTFTDVEAIGLIKFDFLGLKTLTLVDGIVRRTRERRAVTRAPGARERVLGCARAPAPRAPRQPPAVAGKEDESGAGGAAETVPRRSAREGQYRRVARRGDRRLDERLSGVRLEQDAVGG